MSVRSLPGFVARSVIVILTGWLVSCSTPANVAPSARSLARTAERASSSAIQHVIIIVQENRSFDNLFYGYPGANTATSGRTSRGQEVALTPISLAAPYDVLHGSADFFLSWNLGKMDGFNQEPGSGDHKGLTNFQYGYVPDSERQPYIALANQYVLADNAFPSQLDGSFTAHQYIYAAQANHAVNYPAGPWGCLPRAATVPTLTPQRTKGPRESACFVNQASLPRELDGAGVSWRWYGTLHAGYQWVGVQADHYLRFGPTWGQHFVSPSTQFIADVAAGSLAGVTWITPSLHNSDHSGSRSSSGPQYVASLVNAVGQSSFWSSSVIFVLWDDWGGWYDHVPPPQLDYDGLGIRVPMLCISPYAAAGVVSHELYETASVVKFVEQNWSLPALAAADARANSAGEGCLNLGGKPRSFAHIATTLRPADLVDWDDPAGARVLQESERGGGD